MQIDWKITNTDRFTNSNFIFTAHWTATATDGAYTASIYSTCSWAAGTPTIPYAQVTEAEVLDWVWASGVDKEEIEANLANQINALKNPTSATGVPWQ